MKIQVIRRRPFVFSPGGAILAWPVHTGLGIDVYRPMVTGFFICLVSFCFAAAAAAAAAAGRSSLSFRFLCAPPFSLGFTCQSLPNGLVTGYFFTGFPWGFAGFHSTTRRTSLLLFFCLVSSGFVSPSDWRKGCCDRRPFRSDFTISLFRSLGVD